MQLFETLFLFCAAFFLFIQLKRKKTRLPLLSFILILLLSLHLILEGYRWQMIPAYAVVVLGLLLLTASLKRIMKYVLIILSSILLIISALLGYLIPIFEFPEPGGPYSVGKKTIYLKDTSRLDLISEEKGDFRKLVVNVYYPSEQEVTSPESYLDEGLHSAFAKSLGMPKLIFSHLPRVETNLQVDLPVAAGQPFSAVVLSHGLGWNSELYISLIQELVSSGYVVFGVEHTYENAQSIYEGEKISQHQATMDAMDENVNFDSFKVLLEKFKSEEDSVQKLEKMKKMVALLPYNKSFKRWSGDISFTIDELIRLNADKNSFLFSKINPENIGLLGHSWGGAAAVLAASEDPRAKAVINMDGAQWGPLINRTLDTPLLSILADRNYEEFFTPNIYVYDQVTSEDYYQVQIQNTGHASFGDVGYWARLPQLTDAGTIDAAKMTQVTSALIENFFKKFVKRDTLSLPDVFNVRQYPELNFQEKK